MTDFAIRPATEADLAFILQSWVRTYTRSQRWGPLSPRHCATAVHASIVELLSVPGTYIAVATNPENTWFVHGYVVYSTPDSGPIVHWVYVKELYRGIGLGSDLIAHATKAGGDVRYTYKTPAAKALLPTATWAPHLARPKRNNP